METLLKQLNSVPSVIGSLICNYDGKVQAHLFPPLFQVEVLNSLKTLLAENATGYPHDQTDTELIDFRYKRWRVLIKSTNAGYLLLLCEQDLNLQLLKMSMNVALKRIERGGANQQNADTLTSHPTPSQDKKPDAPPVVRIDGKRIILTVDSMRTSTSINWDQMSEHAAICVSLANQLSKLSKTGTFKKIKLTNNTTGTTKVIHVKIMDHLEYNIKEDKIALTLAASEVLKVKPGDEVTAELQVSSGLFS